jgi:pimeloyl-ACP methyl ester carboxylesterase
LIKQGRRVIAVKSLRGVSTEKLEDNVEKVDDDKETPETLLRQVAAIIPVLEHKKLDKVSMIGESRGGAISVAAAYLYPEKFENITLVNPVGMNGEMSTAKLIYRFLGGGAIEGVKLKWDQIQGKMSPMAEKQSRESTKAFVDFVVSDVKTSYKEVSDMAKAELFQKLKEIKKHNIGISIIHGVDDIVFPMADIQRNVSNEIAKFKQANPDGKVGEIDQLDGVDKVIDGFYSVTGAHGAFATKPEVYTRAAAEAMAALETKAAKNKKG